MHKYNIFDILAIINIKIQYVGYIIVGLHRLKPSSIMLSNYTTPLNTFR